jgi:hypothetical protein
LAYQVALFSSFIARFLASEQTPQPYDLRHIVGGGLPKEGWGADFLRGLTSRCAQLQALCLIFQLLFPRNQ